jgi:hypothetical protein
VLAIGGFAGTANFGGGNLTSAGSRDVMIVELAPYARMCVAQRP